jgi:hypothetical protein
LVVLTATGDVPEAPAATVTDEAVMEYIAVVTVTEVVPVVVL